MTKAKSKAWGEIKSKPRCYESHPAYEVAPGKVIYGGACGWPIVKDADVYGGFDPSMKMQPTGKYPWSPVANEGPVEFLFEITDMQAPKSGSEFERMVVWLAEQLDAGKKVHIGCIGGHGRTGMVLAALRKHMTGDEDATQHVRDHYCKKAVESATQIAFLQKMWGINPVSASKTLAPVTSSKGGTQMPGGKFTEYGVDGVLPGFDMNQKQKYHQFDDRQEKPVTTGAPLHSENSIWA